jgi:hypothetical protein
LRNPLREICTVGSVREEISRLEGLLEECHIKLSSLVSDLLGASARRMLKALAEGETNPAALAAMADKNLRATRAQLCDALGACTELKPIYRRLLKMFLEELQRTQPRKTYSLPGLLYSERWRFCDN